MAVKLLEVGESPVEQALSQMLTGAKRNTLILRIYTFKVGCTRCACRNLDASHHPMLPMWWSFPAEDLPANSWLRRVHLANRVSGEVRLHQVCTPVDHRWINFS